MLRLPRFRYYSARTVEEAVRILSDYGSEAMPVAGGTDVYPKMKRRQFEPKVLVGLRQVRDLAEVKGDSSRGMSIGAGVTLTMIVQNKELAASYPALVRACQVIAHPQIRNMGTLGGNLCLDTRCTYYDQTFFLAGGSGILSEERRDDVSRRAGKRSVLGGVLDRWSACRDCSGCSASARRSAGRASDSSQRTLPR